MLRVPLATVRLLFLGMTVLWPDNIVLAPWILGIALLAVVGAIGFLLATRSVVTELHGLTYVNLDRMSSRYAHEAVDDFVRDAVVEDM